MKCVMKIGFCSISEKGINSINISVTIMIAIESYSYIELKQSYELTF